MTDRESVLGFKPQKETPYNKFLPYADRLDVESNIQLAEIKANLARAIQFRDIKIGTAHWTGQLSKYIRLYGHKFSKDDHLHFIHLTYELISIPDLDFTLVTKFAQLLTALIKKKELLLRSELELQWRPLYNILRIITFSSLERHGLLIFPTNMENVMKTLVRSARVYFPVSATQEMLDEWRPLMCPFDTTFAEAMYFFDLFLPTTVAPEEYAQGYKLWLDEFISIWNSCQNGPSWEGHLVSLFSRLANDTIGYIDWSPWIPQIFTRLLRSFNLPVGSSQLQVGRSGNMYEIGNSTTWIIALMGGESSAALDHVGKLFKALESFYHPSNVGKWHSKLVKLMWKLPQAMVKRLHRERYEESGWPFPEIPESCRISDADVTRLVDIVTPIVFTAMFGKYGSHDASMAFMSLATLRPERVVPGLLDKTYPALETLTEPHRLTACLHCVVSVARQMLDSHRFYPEGRSHVIPLLNLSLPGIDPNDCKKSLITFQMISTLVSWVPVKDCSNAMHERKDLTEDERELCSATAQFPDFVLMFLDKLFLLIENSAHSATRSDLGGNASREFRLNQEESMLEVGLLSTFNALMNQVSADIHDEALKRLHRFITTSVLEINVSGRFAGDLVRCAVKIDTEKALKLFLMHFFEIIRARCIQGDLSKEEHMDNEFLWSLKMLTEAVRCDARFLLKYKDELSTVLKYTLHAKCKDTADLSVQLLKNYLRSLTTTYAEDYRSVVADWEQPLADYLPVRDWGRPGDLDDLGMKWHVPSAAELATAQEVMDKVVGAEVARIQDYIGGAAIDREELQQCLCIIASGVNGGGSVIPGLEGEPVPLVESLVPMTRFGVVATGDDTALLLNGKPLRAEIAATLTRLIDHMLQSSEDDTKSFNRIVHVYTTLLFYHGTVKDDFESRWKSVHVLKKSMENKLIGKKKHMRALLVDRVQLQHDLRVTNRCPKDFSVQHKQIFDDLVRLSVSRYSAVRIPAQKALDAGLHIYAYSYHSILDDVLPYLANSDTVSHDQFKGALHVILGIHKRSFATKRNWDVLAKVWPALVVAQHSEKPSIHKLMDGIMDKVHKNIESTELSVQVHDGLLVLAETCFRPGQTPAPALPPLTLQEAELGRQAETQRNAAWRQSYNDLIEKLVQQVESENLNWRFMQMGLEMLELLIRGDTPYPAAAARLFSQNMVHDTLLIRKICTNAVSAILKMQKRRHVTETFDPYAVSNTQPPKDTNVVAPGDRPDNVWLHYDGNNGLTTEAAWDAAVMVEKTHWGYYTWPRSMKKYAPESQQPKLGRSYDELSDWEKPIYECFTSTEFVDKLIGFLTLEENKGKDKFHPKYFTLFKGLFTAFDVAVLEPLKCHVERLAADTAHDTTECSQRCAAEIISGAIRGSKHWGFARTAALWAWLCPVVKGALKNVTVESIGDWGTCFATASESRDPRRLAPILDLLMDEPLQGDGGSFADSSRLYVLQGALAQQEWRVPALLHRLLTYLKPQLPHTYKNVRDRLGSVLVNIFLYDLDLPNSVGTKSPSREALLREILPQLQILHTETPSVTTSEEKMDASDSSNSITMATDAAAAGVDAIKLQVLDGEKSETTENGESEERKVAVRLCKTTLKWLQGCFSRMYQCVSPEMLDFLPLLCWLTSETTDVELRSDVLVTLACLGYMPLPPNVVTHMTGIVRQVSGSASWHARRAILGYLQVTVFCNLFVVDTAETKADIRAIVVDRLEDEQLEVREMASVTLSGLLHCGYLSVDPQLMSHFQSLASTKVKRKRGSTAGAGEKQEKAARNLVRRHAGILGLAACVAAFPYHVPDFVPEILMTLSGHVDDPQPIQLTVKKTLSDFKRTHHDNWTEHRRLFTDDQLGTLTDLLVSPNYYA